MRTQIEYFMRKHPQYTYYATGDMKQLKAPKVSDKEFKYLIDKIYTTLFLSGKF